MLYEVIPGQLGDLLVGYLDPTDDVPQAQQVQPGQSDDDDSDDEEEDKGPDPVEAKKRFTALKRQYNKTQKVIKEKGRGNKAADEQLVKLGEAFSPFKLVPRHYDEMVDMARMGLAHARSGRGMAFVEIRNNFV